VSLTPTNTIAKNCDNRPKFDKNIVYNGIIIETAALLEKKGKKLILHDVNEFIFREVAAWYANDESFGGDLRKGILIRGTCGTGKTLLAKAMQEVILKMQRLHAGFTYSVDLQRLYTLQNTEAIDILKNRKITIIDDLGVEQVATRHFGNIQEPFNDLFDHRYRNELKTIVTTNLTPGEIKDRYGDRIIERFRETMNDIVMSYASFRA
jgi:DNA replication protein DnaC